MNGTWVFIEGAAAVALGAGLKDVHHHTSRKIAVVICDLNVALETHLSMLCETDL